MLRPRRSQRGSDDVAPETVDPRIERSRAVILDATLEELAEVGYGALTIESIARRAQVGKATVYRHWDTKLDLLADAITTLKQDVGMPVDGDLRTRIVVFLQGLAAHLADSRLSACMPAIIDASEREDAVRAFHNRSSQERRAMFVGVLEEARDAGHLDADVDVTLLAEALVGPLFVRRLMTPDPYPPDEVERLVATVLDPSWRP